MLIVPHNYLLHDPSRDSRQTVRVNYNSSGVQSVKTFGADAAKGGANLVCHFFAPSSVVWTYFDTLLIDCHCTRLLDVPRRYRRPQVPGKRIPLCWSCRQVSDLAFFCSMTPCTRITILSPSFEWEVVT